MANKKISELQSRTPALSDLMLVGDPSSGYSYKCTVTALATIIETDIADGYVTIGTTQTISGAKTFSNNLTLTSVVNTPTDPDKFLTLNASNVVTYRTGAEVLSDIGGVGGSGTTNYLPKFSATTTLANSQIFDNGTNIGIATATPDATARVQINKTDGYGLYLNYNTSVGSGVTTTALYAINTTASSGYAAVIEEKTPNTTAGQYPFVIKHSLSSGTAGVGFGTGVHFQLLDDAGTSKTTQLTIENIDAAAATYKTRYRFNVQNNGSSTPVVYINATGLGVFTASPSVALDVTGEGKFSTINNATTDTDKFLVSDGGVVKYRTGSEVLSDIGAASSSSISGTTNYIPKFTSSSAIGNSAIYDASGSILIGKTSSDVNNWLLQLYSTSGTQSGVQLTYGGVGSAGIWENSSGALVFGNDGASGTTERMRLTSGGLLGLGTSSPAYNLHISSSSNEPGIGLTSTATGGRTYRIFTNPAWSTGSLQIYDATADDARISILSSGNVGIGNISPSYKLDVNGSFNFTTGGNYLTYNSGILYHGNYYQYPSGNNYLLFARASGALLFGSNDTERMRLDASGNLGINTSSPSAKLDVVGGNGDGIQYRTSTRAIGIGQISNEASIFWGNGTPLTFNSGTLRMTLDASGNLGLGVTPSATAGGKSINIGAQGYAFSDGVSYQYNSGFANNAYVNGNGTYAAIVSRAAGILEINESSFIWKQASSGTAGSTLSLTSAMTLDASGRLGIGATSMTYALQVNDVSGGNMFRFTSGSTILDYYVSAGNPSFGTASNNNLGFRTNDTERMRITSGGYVGIGTTSPVVGLQVQDAGNTFAAHFSGLNQTNGVAIGTNSTNVATIQGYTRTFSATNNISINPDGGNVGIGTTSPGSILELYQATPILTFNGTTPSSAFGLEFKSGGLDAFIKATPSHGLFNIASGRSAGWGGFITFTTDASERMRITSGGNVGIGSSSPASLLAVGGNPPSAGTISAVSAAGGITLALSDNVNSSLYIRNTNGGALIGTDGGGTIRFATSGNTNSEERMRLTSTGELLINTTSDAGDYKLQVNGNVYTTGIGYINGGIVGNSSNNLYLSSNSSGGEISFWANQLNTRLMTILGGGDVGIGVSSPSAKLEVNGAIKTAAPSGGTAAAWKLGERVASSGLTLNDTQYIQLDIAGTLYTLATVNLP